MCMLCVEIQKKSMSVREVARAYRECDIPSNHTGEILASIQDAYGLEQVAKELNELFLEEIKKDAK